MRPAPSVKRLVGELNLTPKCAATVRAVIHGQVNPCDVSPRTAAWVDKCYHPPTRVEQKMSALDELIGGYGVEAIWGRDGSPTECYGSPVAEYVNMGETYTATILRTRAGAYLLTSWGDWVERNTRRYGIQ